MHVRLQAASPDPARELAAMTDSHLSVTTLASYVDDALDAEARAAANRHLAACGSCRAELVELTGLVLDAPSAPRTPNWAVMVGALAAAGLVGILVTSPERPTTRSSSAERATKPAAAALEIVEPRGAGAPGALRDGRIVWRAVEPQATYRVTVTDTTGATRWSAETSDTVAVLPSSARLEAGARYYLYIDALRADGWSLQSGPHAFTTAR
jgi:anti-sigma factor RsiW